MVILMKEKDIEKKINEVLNKVRPYLQDEGGDVVLNRYENGIAYVSLRGACAHCSMATLTLQDVVEEALTQEVEEVIKVVNEN